MSLITARNAAIKLNLRLKEIERSAGFKLFFIDYDGQNKASCKLLYEQYLTYEGDKFMFVSDISEKNDFFL